MEELQKEMEELQKEMDKKRKQPMESLKAQQPTQIKNREMLKSLFNKF